ncbi:hypothetical protein BJL90_06950 [Clostridium formicaceticum]|nr:hypothetical protein BJL90_06950 [Clostridium formicaceticum]
MTMIKEAVEEYNQLQETEEDKIPFGEETKLYGNGGLLKSIDLVTLIVELEYKLEERYGLLGVLTDEKAMSQKNSPFRTIQTLADYISSLEVA